MAVKNGEYMCVLFLGTYRHTAAAERVYSYNPEARTGRTIHALQTLVIFRFFHLSDPTHLPEEYETLYHSHVMEMKSDLASVTNKSREAVLSVKIPQLHGCVL